MKHTYKIAATILIDYQPKRCYLTVFDNWVLDEANTDIEIFLTMDKARERLGEVSKCLSKKIIQYMIINDRGYVLHKFEK